MLFVIVCFFILDVSIAVVFFLPTKFNIITMLLVSVCFYLGCMYFFFFFYQLNIVTMLLVSVCFYLGCTCKLFFFTN